MPVPPWSGAFAPRSPEPGEPTPTPAVFTVASATRLLPYLRATLSAAQAHVASMRALGAEMRRMEAVGRRGDGALILAADHAAAQRRRAGHGEECERLLRQIATHGCQVKDLTSGLCDFPAVVEGRPVLLCWRMDEPAIAHYHGETEGFAGRHPLPPDTP